MQGYYDTATPESNTSPMADNHSREPLTDYDLAAIIDEQINDSTRYEESNLAMKRQKAIKYFEGNNTLDGDVPYMEGRSSVVSMDLADTHGWIMPSLLRTLAGGDRYVLYRPTRPGAEEPAKQATDYINYVFNTECDGYRVLHNAIFDGLLLGNGVIKHFWDESPKYEVETRVGITETEFIQLAHDPNVQILQHTASADSSPLAPMPDAPASAYGQEPVGMPGPAFSLSPGMAQAPNEQNPGAASILETMGAPSQFMGNPHPDPSMMTEPLYLHDVKIRRKVNSGRLCVMAIPQEEFRINRGATQLDEDHVTFCAHVSLVTRSSLVEEGYARDIVDSLNAHTGSTINARSRFGDYLTIAPSTDDSTDLIERWECYVKLDYDGDGVAELRRVVVADGVSCRTILYNEEWPDDLPFSDLVPDPRPFSWRGTSLFDRMEDIQRIKTVFMRGINDNLYWVNNPQREAVMGQIENPQQLSNPTYGGTLWVRSPGAVRDLAVPFVADKLMAGLELMDKVREFRTGVSSGTMALDPEALANQTAEAVKRSATASYSKIETHARNTVVGMSRMFRCILRIVVKHQTTERDIPLRDKWMTMNPSTWDSDMDASVTVGLGSGSRDRDMAMLAAIAGKQEAFIAKATPQVAEKLGMGVDKLFHTYRLMVEAGNLKSPELFFPEIPIGASAQIMDEMQQQQQQAQQQPPPPDPASLAKAQAIQQETQASLQMQQQKADAEAQAAERKMAMDWQARQAQAELDNQHRADELASQHAAKMREIELEHQRATEEAQRKFILMQQEIQAKQSLRMYELQQEAALKSAQMETQPNVQPNIQKVE
jgi:hypothetical protein